MTLYARAVELRNCGRFTHVSSDFGSQFRTHTFVTSEALYASLTREATWRHPGKFVELDKDALKPNRPDYFFCDYDVSRKPLWFTPGLFVNERGAPLAKQRGVTDENDFNVIDEGHPGTGGGGRPYYVPTYGRIESVLPDHRLSAFVFSPQRAEVEWFKTDQIFLMGKKRTMFQVLDLSLVVEGRWQRGICTTAWLELPPHLAGHFQLFEILAATMRYIILRGMTRKEVDYVEFSFQHSDLRLPDFYLERIPFDTGGAGI